MDQIIKWVSGIIFVAIAAHFGVLNYVEPRLDKGTDNQEIQTQAALPVELNRTEVKHVEQEEPLPGRAVRVKAGNNGHFYLDAKINGTRTPFLVDTGASMVALSYESAQRAGIRLKKSDFKHTASTANGQVAMAVVMLDSVRFKNILVRNVRAGVLPKGALGGANLLGNSFLSRLREYKVSDGSLIMRP
ncbi:MAG: TIGR02281 family clan AA aspartic protease [Hyphomicrobiales bacterium]